MDDSQNNGLSWFSNLRHQFSTFCSGAEDIVTQEPIEFFRDQLLTTCGSIRHLCSVLVEEALPIFTLDFLDEQGPTSTEQEEYPGLPPHELSNISTDDILGERSEATILSHFLSTEPEGDLFVNSSSKEKVDIAMEASSCSKTSIIGTLSEQDEEENDLGDPRATLSTYIQSLMLDYSKVAKELPQFKSPDALADFSAGAWPPEAIESSGFKMLDGSLILVDANECLSASDMQRDHLSDQKTSTSLWKKTFAKKPSCKIARQSIDAQTDGEEWERWNEDVSDSDWEII